MQDHRTIWEKGQWTPELIRWQHKLYELFPTQRREVERLTANECRQTTQMYEREYIAWCAVERMIARPEVKVVYGSQVVFRKPWGNTQDYS